MTYKTKGTCSTPVSYTHLEVFCRDSLAVVLDFYPDGIHLIQQANVEMCIRDSSADILLP